MTKYLIINADDFGFAAEINRGIIAVHKKSVLTSTSLMINESFAVTAADLAKKNPNLGIGLHFSALPNENELLQNPDRVRQELERQYKKFCDLLGKPPTHLDSHHHVHNNYAVRPIFLSFAEKYQIPLRFHSSAQYHGDFYGQWYDDHGNPQPCHEFINPDSLEKILRKLPAGITELGCHPGYAAHDLQDSYVVEREIELATLTSPHILRLIRKLNIKLINFAQLPKELKKS